MQRTSPDRLPLRIGSARVVLALGFLAFVALSVRIPAETASVSQVEAAYLYNFTKLAEWPQSKLTGDAPLVIGVFGREDDFIEILRQTVSGKAAGSHPNCG